MVDDLRGGKAEVVCVVDIGDLEPWLDCCSLRGSVIVIEESVHSLKRISLLHNSGYAAGDLVSRPVHYVLPDGLDGDVAAEEEGYEGADDVRVGWE